MVLDSGVPRFLVLWILGPAPLAMVKHGLGQVMIMSHETWPLTHEPEIVD